MKRILLGLIFAAHLSAQWTPFTTQTGSTNLSTAMDAKINWQSSSVACADKSGAVGKDLCVDTGTLKIYKVTVTGTPATWTDVAATAGALAATPTLCSSGQAPTGVLANGNATGCAAVATNSVLASLWVAASQNTASTTPVDLGTPDSVTFNCAATCNFVVQYLAQEQTLTAGVGGCFNTVYIDGTQVDSGGPEVFFAATPGYSYSASGHAAFKATSQAAGSHTVDVKHYMQASTPSCSYSFRTLVVTQVP